MEKKGFFYDDFSDRLMITCKRENEKVSGSVRVLNVTLDLTSEGKIVNVEVRNISEYLNNIGVNSKLLDNLKDAELISKKYNNGYMIYFILKTDKIVEKIPFNLPTITA